MHNSCEYSRVQGGGSEERIKVNDDGSINITNKDKSLYVSVGSEHAEYFLGIRGEGAYIVEFSLPDWVNESIRQNAIPQDHASQNIFNDYLPKIVDPTKPGLSYQLPPSWLGFIQDVAYNAHIV